MSSEPVWLTISEAARVLGVTPQAIRKRLARGTINCRRGNRGQVMVEVANPQQPVQQPVQQPAQPRGQQPVANPSLPTIPWDEHQRIVAALQARHDAELARQLAANESLYRDTLGRLQAQAAAERSLWLERIDAAELRSERLEQRLDQVLDGLLDRQRQPAADQGEPDKRRPWWSRWSQWFGESRRSSLG